MRASLLRLLQKEDRFLPTLINGCQLWLQADRARIGAAQFVAARSEYLSNANAIAASGNFSVEGWVYLDTISADMVLFDQGTAAASKQLLRVKSADSKLYWSMDGGVTESVSAALSTGTWYHVVGTFDGTNQRLYVDGALADTDAVTADYTGVDRFAIGSTTAGGSYMNGRLSLMRMWSKQVVAGEVTSLYNSGRGLSHAQLSGTLLTSLVDSYDMSEASGTRADSAGAKTLTDNNTVMCAPGIIPVVPADAAAISTWEDLSGNGRHATQATEASQPLVKTGIQAGKAVMRLDGTNDLMAFSDSGLPAGNGGRTIIGVIMSNNTGDRHWFSYGTAASQQAFFCGQNASSRRIGFYGNNYDFADIDQASYRVLAVVYDPSNLSLYENGLLDATQAVTGPPNTVLSTGNIGTLIGNALYWQGDIAEIIAYNRALNAGELNRLHQWLGRRYSLGVS